ncbi:histidinol-phosphatase HisJ family protein [Butyrivibrio sp. AE2032]|uniref:histidinol-phosphatase HisJ family protein n=1 Tax=Butyrivibrio sp. AE2032 TaxID=1458463 RepID=UPI000557D3FB|nr:histidinol-phosphatase HisJ family protein [Butyrivibrio sp. AE2032]
MPITSDFHMHSNHSGDSSTPMEDMIKSAIDKGLSEICFTEHLDLDYPDTPDLPPEPFTLDVPSYKKELFSLKDKYKDKITLRFGIEIGMQAQVTKENLAIAKSDSFDFIIASQHLVDRRDPFYPDFWAPDTVENIFNRFFDQTLENIKLFSEFDVLGHLDYISRYVPEGDTTYSYERFADKIDPILEYLIANDKGLDVNSKVLAYSDILPPNPCPEALKRYKELGGALITFGSDAHTPDKIGCCFDTIRQIALDSGFTEYYTFENRKPVAHKL